MSRKQSHKMHLVKCKGCAIQFVPKDKRQKFHSPECRTAYYMAHYGSPSTTKTCANCGTLFSTTKPKKQLYCSPECREEHRLKLQDNLRARVTAERNTFLGERFAAMERDGFRCTFCGKGVNDGVVLDVVNDNGKLRTACSDCKTGKEFIGKEAI